jgi:hypothetical protein
VDGVQTKYLSGPSKVTVSDADFIAPPPDGTVAVVHNSSTNTARLAIRANGTWRLYASI